MAVNDTLTVLRVELDRYTLTLEQGGSHQLTAQVLPAQATDQELIWRSTAPYIADVDENGLVTAGSLTGTATVSAYSLVGAHKADCRVQVVEQIIMPEGIELAIPEIELRSGKVYRLDAAISPANATNRVVTWQSSDPTVAYVSQEGIVVTLPKKGSAVVTATTENGFTASCTFYVTVSASSLTLDQSQLKLKTGSSAQLTATVLPFNAENRNAIWASSKQSVATVDENGLVAAITPGYADITAHAEDNRNLSQRCRITVSDPVIPAEGLALSHSELTVYLDRPVYLAAEVLPANASNRKVVWVTSNDRCITVDADGLIIPHSEGSVTITATSQDGGFTAGCLVTSALYVPLNRIGLQEYFLSVYTGGQQQAELICYPENASVKTMLWQSSDPDIAQVDATGLITAVSAGMVNITAISLDNENIGISFWVNVSDPPVAVSEILLEQSLLELTVGESMALAATALPENAADRSITWQSSDPSVAAVDRMGAVTAASAGKTVLKATSSDGAVSAECTVLVKAVPITLTGFALEQTTLEMDVGSWSRLTAICTPAEAAEHAIIMWSSSDSRVADVDSSGGVTAVAAGQAMIKVSSGDGAYGTYTVECQVTVLALQDAVTGITLSLSESSLLCGEELWLVAEVLPSRAANQEVIWESSDETVAQVSQQGRVTGLTPGAAVVTAITEEGGFRACCAVTVTELDTSVQGIQLLRQSLELRPGMKFHLIAAVTPYYAANQTITWQSSDEQVASVDTYGHITTLSTGQANITCTAEEGGFSACCAVTITDEGVPVQGVALDAQLLTLQIGQRSALNAEVIPENASDPSVGWSSSAPSIVEADSSGRLRALAAGQATITATTLEGGFSASCTVVVAGPVIISPVPVQGVSLDQHSLSLEAGQSVTLAALVTPGNATNLAVAWASDAPSIVEVDSSGGLRALAAGQATITVTTQEGGFSASCEVVVTDGSPVIISPVPVQSVSLGQTILALKAGQSVTLAALVTPGNATNQTVIWVSDTPSVAAVDSFGTVAAVASGLATITATTQEGGFTDSCIVVVSGVSAGTR